MLPKLAPCAKQTARSSPVGPVAGRPGNTAPAVFTVAHGSVPRLVNPVFTGANNSPMFGARTARAKLPRTARPSTGSQVPPALKVVVLNDGLPGASTVYDE